MAAPSVASSELAPAPPTPSALLAQRGDLVQRLILTGEIDAVAATELKVPRTPTGRVTVRMLAPEGTEVKAGDVVAELDATTFATQVRERTLALSQAEMDLARQASENGVKEADAAMDVERKRAVMRRAQIDGDVPPGILPKRDYLEKQLAVQRAQGDFEKAQAVLEAVKQSGKADLAIKRIGLEKVKRALDEAATAMKALTVRAPAAGTVLLGDHNQERRKVQEGDEVLMGWTVARVASSGARSIKAWLSDVDDSRIAVGMNATVVLDAHPGRVFVGKVREISPVARQPVERTQRRMFQVDVDLEDKDEDLLRPGLSARVEVERARHTGVVVPRAALDRGASPPRLYLADGGSVEVAVGACNANACVIERGVEPSTRLRRAP